MILSRIVLKYVSSGSPVDAAKRILAGSLEELYCLCGENAWALSPLFKPINKLEVCELELVLLVA